MGVTPRYTSPGVTISPDAARGWVRRLGPVIKRHRLLFGVSVAAAFIALTAQLAVPAVIRSTIDQALDSRSRELTPFIWALVALGLTRGAFAFAYRYGLYSMAYKIDYDLRAIIYEHLTRLSFSFYDRIQSGQVISRANSDIRSVQMYLAFAPLMAMSLLSFVIALAFMLSINVVLTLLAIFALPGVYLVGVRLRNYIFPLSWIVQSRLADVATIVEENVTGVRVVKSFAAEGQQVKLLGRAAQKLQWAMVRQVLARAHHAPIMENLPRVGIALVLLYGGWLVIEGRLSLGTIVAFNAYILMLQAPFRLLGFFMMLGQRARASAERIFEILDEKPDIVDPVDPVVLDEPAGRVDFEGVVFGYGEGPAVLDGLELHIEPGETVAIVGRTGCGKSTIARLLPRFYDVRTGHVSVDGVDVRQLQLASLRANVGLVLDEPFLFSTSIHDNIAYGRPDADRDEVVAAARSAQAHGFIEQLSDGYDTIIGERGYTLSGGQRQRIAIARTLLVNPRILILDDATSAIDVHVEEAIHDALRNLLKGRTTIVIAHRLSTISLADRVVLMEGGRVVASGSHSSLMAGEPRYAQVLAHAEDEPGDDEAPDGLEREIEATRSRGLLEGIEATVNPLGPGGMGPMGGVS
ncbi:MAG: putative multidrug export ATP-binding/permease protein [Acidimicrobiales bacterium]|nr:putative multidrug export ATP-binding/permease protein [Acidimicrobiales bacterium]